MLAAPLTANVDDVELTAVLDTNVLLDVFSCHDLSTLYSKPGEAPVAADHPTAIYRRARVRDSLLLAMHFNFVAANTYSSHEAKTIMVRCVDPNAVSSMEMHYVAFAAHLVKDSLLPAWTPYFQTEDDNLRGTAVDVALLEFARDHQLPLVTNEGFTEDGVADVRLRKRAKDAGVPVFTPREYFEGRLDEDAAAREFIVGFRREAPRHIAAHPKPTLARETLIWISGYYRHVLFGETEGLQEPMPVRVPARK